MHVEVPSIGAERFDVLGAGQESSTPSFGVWVIVQNTKDIPQHLIISIINQMIFSFHSPCFGP